MSIWNELLGEDKKIFPKSSFDTWLKNTTLLSFDQSSNTLFVRAESEFARDWLESHYTEQVLDILFDITKVTYQLNFVYTNEKFKKPTEKKITMTEREILELLLKKITNIEKEQIAMRTQLDENTEIVKAIHDRLEKTDAKLDNLTFNTHKLQGDVTAMKETVTNIEKRIRNL